MSGEEKKEIDATLRHLEELIEKLDRLGDPAAQGAARQLVELVLDLHGVGLARLVGIVSDADGGASILARATEDDQVRPLLLLHGLHPDDLETRVRRAVERLRPHIGVHGLRLDVVEIKDGTARLKIHAANGAGAKAAVLWSLPGEIEQAIVDAAPDLDKVIVDGWDMPAVAATTPPGG